MTRITVFKTSPVLIKFFIIFGSIFTVFGLYLVIDSISYGFNTKFPSGDWNAIIYLLEGLLFIIMGTINLINKKYYIEWDDKELHFLLPKTKIIETIKFEDIISVNIKLFEIQLKLKDRTKILDLNPLQFEDLKKIKEIFEPIKNREN